MANKSIREIYGSMKSDFIKNVTNMIGHPPINFEHSAYKCILLVVAKNLYELQPKEK